jgi:hypothetical protein
MVNGFLFVPPEIKDKIAVPKSNNISLNKLGNFFTFTQNELPKFFPVLSNKTYILFRLNETLDRLNIEEIFNSNLSEKGGNFVVRFVLGREVNLEKYSSDQIIIPFSSSLKLIARKFKGRLKDEKDNVLIMQEPVFIQILSTFENSGFHIETIYFKGEGNYIFKAKVKGGNIIDYDTVLTLLNNGFTFKNCVFRRENIFFGVDRNSRLWSNDRSVIGKMSTVIGEFISDSLKGMEIFYQSNLENENILFVRSSFSYLANLDVVAEIKKRIGNSRINLHKRFKDGSLILYVFMDNKKNIVMLHFYGNKLSVIPMASSDINTIIEINEIAKKSGGIFVGK